MFFRMVAVLLLSVQMAGCMTYPVAASNFTYVGAPPAPRIITGQKASLYIGDWGRDKNPQDLANAWQSTGLFSEVRLVSSRVPSITEVFIETDCRWLYSSDTGDVLLAIVTLFALTGVHSNEQVCKTAFYQNGTLLVRTSLGMAFDDATGLLFLPLFPLDIAVKKRNHQDQAAFVVVHALSALSGMNP